LYLKKKRGSLGETQGHRDKKKVYGGSEVCSFKKSPKNLADKGHVCDRKTMLLRKAPTRRGGGNRIYKGGQPGKKSGRKICRFVKGPEK